MNYFNFFETAQKEKKPLNVKLLAGFFLGLIVVCIAGTYFVKKTRLENAKKDLAFLQQVQNDPGFRAQYSAERNLQKNVDKVEGDYAFLATLDWAVDHASTVRRDLIEKVFACMGKNAKIIKMTVGGSDIALEGVARNLQTLIDVEKSLNTCGLFTDVFVSSAKADNNTDENGADAVTFSCHLTIAEKGAEKK